MADNTTGSQGLSPDSSMSAEERKRVQSEGGKASSGNFAKDKHKASTAGKAGGRKSHRS